jgi:O-acetylserine/cysteine efflux transporter
LGLSVLGLFFVLAIEDGSVTLLGFVFAIVGAFSLSVISLIIKKAQIKEMFAFVVWSCLFAPIPLFVLSYLVNGSSGFGFFGQEFNQAGLASALFQAYPTTLLGYWIWNKLQTRYPLSTMAPLSLLVPIFGVMGSVIFYNEQLATAKIIACILIVSGVALPLFGETLRKFVSINKRRLNKVNQD